MPELSIVVLCYKTGELAKDISREIIDLFERNNILDYQLILIGNYLAGSDDPTPKIVVELAANNPRILSSAKPKEGMMGWDMKSGLNLATGRYVAVIDGDGQMPLEDIIKVYYKIKNSDFDLVKTYRASRADGLSRKIISAIYNLLFAILFPGLKAKDINSKPKIFTSGALKKLNLVSDGWFIEAEMMIQARRLKFKIGEIPTVFHQLDSRKSFIGVSAILEFIKNLIIFRIREFKNKS